MFCPKCGKELKEGARFCTACGNPLNFVASDEPKNVVEEPARTFEQPEQIQNENYAGYDNREASGNNDGPVYGAMDDSGYDDSYDGYDDYYEDVPAPKKSKKPLIITLCVIAAAIVVGLVLYFAVFAKGGFGKENTLEAAATKTMDAFAGRSDVTSVLKGISKEQKFGVNVKVDNLGNLLSLYNSYMSVLNIEAELDIAADSDGNASVAASADGMGLEASAGAYLSKGGQGDIIISIPKFLDDAYGVSLGTIAEDLDDSIFNPDSDSDYAIPEYAYESVIKVAESVGTGMGSISPEAVEELKKELESNEDAKIEFEKSREKIEIAEDEVACEVYRTSIDADKIESIFDVTLDWAEDNFDLAGLLTPITGGNVSVSELSKQMTSALKEVDIDMDLEYDVYKGYLVRSEISGKIQGEKVKIEAVFGPDPTKAEEISFTAKISDMDFSFTVDLSKAEKNQITAVAESKSADIYFEFAFDYSDKDKEFEASLKNAYRDFRISGGMELSDETVVISDPSFYSDGEKLLILKGVTVTMTKNPTVRTAKGDYPDGYTNILKLKEDDFEELGQKLYDMTGVIG